MTDLGMPDGTIHHFTTTKTLLSYILPQGKLRFSSFGRSMDPRERVRLAPGFGIEGFTGTLGENRFQEHQRHCDDWMTKYPQMLCFSKSYTAPRANSDLTQDSHRVWAQAAMWVHFAEGASGVCLEFDKKALEDEFVRATDSTGIRMAGDVLYLSPDSNALHIPNILYPDETYPRAGAVAGHLTKFSCASYFTKHINWSYENEFRLVVINSCGEPAFIPIRNCLRRIIVTDDTRRDDTQSICWAVEDAGIGVPVVSTRLSGDHPFDPEPIATSPTVGPPQRNWLPTLGGRHLHTKECIPEQTTIRDQECDERPYLLSLVQYYVEKLAAEAVTALQRRGLCVTSFLLPKFTFPLSGQELPVCRIDFPHTSGPGLIYLELRSDAAAKMSLMALLQRGSKMEQKVFSLSVSPSDRGAVRDLEGLNQALQEWLP